MIAEYNISWQQVALIALMLVAAFAAHIYFGMAPGMALGFVTTSVAFFLGRKRYESQRVSDPPPKPPWETYHGD